MTTNRESTTQALKAVGDSFQALSGVPNMFFYLGNLGGETYNYFLYNYYWYGAVAYLNPNPTPLPPTGPVSITQLVPNGGLPLHLTGVRITCTPPIESYVPTGNAYDWSYQGNNCYRAFYEFSVEGYNPVTQVVTQYAVVDLPIKGLSYPTINNSPVDFHARISGNIPAGSLVYLRHYATGVVQYPGAGSNTWTGVNFFLEFQ